MSYPSRFVEFFGPSTWKTLHSIAFNYAENADNPTNAEKRDIVDLFRLFGKFLPCPSCKIHYNKYINEHPVDASTRSNLTIWLYDFHSAVNKRTHKLSNITYEEHVNDYAGWNELTNKRYSSLSSKNKLKSMADPHFGRPVYIKGNEKLIGKVDVFNTIGFMAITALAGFATYNGVNKMLNKPEDENKNKK